MRTLKTEETALVHGAGPIWDWIKEMWETKESTEDKIETMKDWMELYNDYQTSVQQGDVSPEAACKALGDALKLVPGSDAATDKAYAATLVAGLCNHAAQTVTDGIKRLDDAIKAEENGDPPPGDDTAMNYDNSNWLENLLAGYNEQAVQDYWDGSGSYGEVEIEICYG